ncbi:TlpA disulfide reductase family protein [Hymenobacter cheonanensis]|uniref:TlpA disulfide reductase family protein n=1 Tax=Hymenobacter sp. CA2-7 TaxID=3063993 RepID=UPI0027125D91|nr:TlpA disulfide reductase family protein [Hymenobacter sp. CA2-7]MDO7886147.1 TlpA disulfide reductase family protein [Hymenobacter sp. CA2-7]
MNKLCLLLALALAGSSASAQSCLVSGTITGIGAKPIIFRYTQQGKMHHDTVRAVNDRFTYTARPSDDGKIVLFVAPPRYDSFWVEPGKVTVTGDAALLGHLAIAGTPENDLQNEFDRTIGWKYDVSAAKTSAEEASTKALYNQGAIRFIKAHPAARTSADLLYWQMLMAPSAPLAKYEQLAAQLAPPVRQSPQGQMVIKRLQILQNQPTIGRPVADFTIADTAGVKHSLATYRGKYVLLDFWGHWCTPCVQAMPKVNALHQQYAGKLTIIGIAMEGATSAPLWKKAIRKYAVPGLQLSELQTDEGPVISGYNVTAYPTYMLLDPKGILVMSTNDVDDITKKLTALGTL